ncbi:MAG: ribosome maturation factor RimP [Alphaproteobacteria bacterium]|nr:ribosome maturation factor RimP [Alphaproteobacteria bacterium]
MRHNTLEQIIEPVLEDMGYDLVRVLLHGIKSKTLQIMAEHKDGKKMTVTDCAKISRNLSAVLDVEDPIEEPYALEISSPGLDRPLVRLKDFERYSGFEAKVEMRDFVDDRKRFRGKLLGISSNNVVRMEFEGKEIELPFDGIGKAKLMLTDELITASLKK